MLMAPPFLLEFFLVSIHFFFKLKFGNHLMKFYKIPLRHVLRKYFEVFFDTLWPLNLIAKKVLSLSMAHLPVVICDTTRQNQLMNSEAFVISIKKLVQS
jgi:hypothetical protein